MAKKRAAKVNAAKIDTTPKPVRLVLPPAEHQRLERLASRMGLSMSAYARMVVIRSMKEDEVREMR
jgi:hypothetical protein